MIYSVRIGEIEASIDDELTEERPTPEVVADYLHRCATEVLRVYSELPAEAVAGADDED